MIPKVADKPTEYIITLYRILNEIAENGPVNINLFTEEMKPGYFDFHNSTERQNFSIFLKLVHKYQQIYNDQSVEREHLEHFFDSLLEKIKYPLTCFDMTDLEKNLKI